MSGGIAIVGAGPAGLMAADALAGRATPITVYDRMPSAGRKFLLAGRGGLNLTHSEDLAKFLPRYGEAEARLQPAIESFSPTALRNWCARLGENTVVGSSGRVFPKSFKASPLLRAWLKRLDAAGVRFAMRHRWVGWDDGGDAAFETPQGRVTIRPDVLVLALGGASWPRLGSDGSWVDILAGEGIAITPLVPANCGFVAPWSDVFRDRFEGQPLKRIALAFAGQTVRGEAMVTRSGLEGGSVYALSAPLRRAIAARGEAVLRIDLRPDMTTVALQRALERPRGGQSLANVLRKAAKLSPVAIGLLHEAALAGPERLGAMSAAPLADLIRSVPIRLTGTAPLATAISTAGGVSLDEIDERFMLRRRPGVFVAGEMLDWEAPTGGYLMQASVSTAVAAAQGAWEWWHTQRRRSPPP